MPSLVMERCCPLRQTGSFEFCSLVTVERQVPLASITAALSRSELVVSNVATDLFANAAHGSRIQAHALPLLENAASLTSARIDLLPHQVVLTHRIATASPRRYLIADEVGLGKTIETALVLRSWQAVES